MAFSGFFLWMDQRHIPIGTAYAVWTGIGAAGTFLVGIVYYGDPTSIARYAAATGSAASGPSALERYQPPPYIWEGKDGAMTAANDIADVPQEVRPRFELRR